MSRKPLLAIYLHNTGEKMPPKFAKLGLEMSKLINIVLLQKKESTFYLKHVQKTQEVSITSLTLSAKIAPSSILAKCQTVQGGREIYKMNKIQELFCFVREGKTSHIQDGLPAIANLSKQVLKLKYFPIIISTENVNISR